MHRPVATLTPAQPGKSALRNGSDNGLDDGKIKPSLSPVAQWHRRLKQTSRTDKAKAPHEANHIDDHGHRKDCQEDSVFPSAWAVHDRPKVEPAGGINLLARGMYSYI